MEHPIRNIESPPPISLCVAWCSLLLLGCTRPSPECAELDEIGDRDACFYDRAVACAEADDLECATRALDDIHDPTMRSFATEKVMVVAPSGLTPEIAGALCTALDKTAAAACLRNYSRPHLWTR